MRLYQLGNLLFRSKIYLSSVKRVHLSLGCNNIAQCWEEKQVSPFGHNNDSDSMCG